ncbi:hypothetical protein [Antarcticirhabdus aurantiaca]|uniref:Uncharacterized protein n=1 Tax=Antarcticirhabdus aurantiaca TaxID=2606717 RepID=A0ACD4NRW5_9HYPH|nr:hypothetical protein [Antarcticirhabdus aurantiaca]WAJ29463.1 hypothetical protein OXU80_04290 [Jeongeuplla avenae]
MTDKGERQPHDGARDQDDEERGIVNHDTTMARLLEPCHKHEYVSHILAGDTAPLEFDGKVPQHSQNHRQGGASATYWMGAGRIRAWRPQASTALMSAHFHHGGRHLRKRCSDGPSRIVDSGILPALAWRHG